jgi:DNA-binding SARP family transcriptional activator
MIEIFVFGETRIVEGDREVGPRDFGGHKARQLLEVLVLHAGHPVSKHRLIACLWGDCAPVSAAASIEAYVSVVRRHLAPGRSAAKSPLRTTAGGYVLDPCRVRIDLVEFHRLVATSHTATTDQARPLLRQALALATGELFESDPDAPWAVESRAAAHTTLVQACADAGQRALNDGSWDDAIALGRRALTLDPLSEPCVRVLVEGLWRAGRRAEALRAFDRLRCTLADELGVDPDRSTQSLHLAVLRDAAQPVEPVGESAPGVTQIESLFGQLVHAVRKAGGDRHERAHLVARLSAELELARLAMWAAVVPLVTAGVSRVPALVSALSDSGLAA